MKGCGQLADSSIGCALSMVVEEPSPSSPGEEAASPRGLASVNGMKAGCRWEALWGCGLRDLRFRGRDDGDDDGGNKEGGDGGRRDCFEETDA